MWIDRTEYRRLVEASAASAALTAQVASQTATIEWLRLRVNQVEAERGALLAKVAQVPVAVPTIQQVPTVRPPREPLMATPVETDTPDVLGAIAALFEDVGDDMAEKIGATHGPSGELAYR